MFFCVNNIKNKKVTSLPLLNPSQLVGDGLLTMLIVYEFNA